MAIVVRTNPVAGASATFPDDYNNQNTKYLAGQRGYARVDLSDYADGATAPTIVVGSEFEFDGDMVVVQTANESITGIASIAASSVVYIYFSYASTDFFASTTAPTWSTALGGWYNGSARALFKMYKNSGSSYVGREAMKQVSSSGGISYIYETSSSGSWTAPYSGIYKVICVGGGGGGGGSTNGRGGGGGGGGAAIQIAYIEENTAFTLIVGAAGAGGTTSGTNGSDGGTTDFDATVISYIGVQGFGGKGGTGSTSGTALNQGGVGGYGGTGSIETRIDGDPGNYLGAGGRSYISQAPQANSSLGAGGSSISAGGAGGGGAWSDGGTPYAGGAGEKGAIYIYFIDGLAR